MFKLEFINKVVERMYFAQPNNLALYDQLTHLYNANWLYKIGNKKWSNRKCYVTVVDLNNFKQINDVLGHVIGNAVLMSVAYQLSQISVAYPNSDVCRIGGDEFLVFSNVDITSFFTYDKVKLVSYGVHVKPKDMPIPHAISIADKIMYKYKENNKVKLESEQDVLNTVKIVMKEKNGIYCHSESED